MVFRADRSVPVSVCPDRVGVVSVLQEHNPRQRLCGERPEGNLSVVPSRRAAALGARQRPLGLQLTGDTCCLLVHRPVGKPASHYCCTSEECLLDFTSL